MEDKNKQNNGALWLALVLIGAGGYCGYDACCKKAPPPDKKAPKAPKPRTPAPTPVPKPEPKPKPKPRRPWREDGCEPLVEGRISGPSLDGTEVDNDFPGDLHRRNTASKGLGNCVFTSIHHAALWQNVPALQEFPKWLIDKGIPGGGYPGKVEKLIPQIARDRGMEVPDYIQVQGMDLEILKRASKSGRLLSVTYSFSPTGRYGGRRISHMVSVVSTPEPGSDKGYWVVLDNNYPGADKYEWLTDSEFRKTYAPGWTVILLAPPPPPIPRNYSYE